MIQMLSGRLKVMLALGGNMGGKTVWTINALVLPFCLPKGHLLNPYIAAWPFMQERHKFMRFSGTMQEGTHRIGLIIPPMVLHQAFIPKLKEWAPKNSWYTSNDNSPQIRRIIFNGGGELVIYSPNQKLSEQAGGELDFVLAIEPFPVRVVGEVQGRIRTWGGMFFENCPDYNKDAADLVRLVEIMRKEDSHSAIIHSFHLASTCAAHELNGFVPHYKIERKIKEVQSLNPHSVPARIAGLPMYYANRVFPQFDANKHVWPEQDIIEELRAEGATFYEGIDPHDNWPYATLICAVDSRNRLFVLEENPRYDPNCEMAHNNDWFVNATAPKHQPFHMLKVDWADDYQKIIKVLYHTEKDLIARIGGGLKSDGTCVHNRVNSNIYARYMDPRFSSRGAKAGVGKTSSLKMMRKYGNRYGMYFFKSPQEGNLEWRHRAIRGLLAGINPYTEEEIKEQKVLDITEIIVSERCQNFIYAMENITYIVETVLGARDTKFHSEPKVDDDLKHFIDAFSYIIQRKPTYQGNVLDPVKKDEQIIDMMMGDIPGLPSMRQNHGERIVCN